MFKNRFNKESYIPITITITLIIVVIMGIIIYRQFQEVQILKRDMRIIEIPNKEEIIGEIREEISKWETYINKEYGFEIDYLKVWEVNIKDASYWCQENPEYDCLAYIQFFPYSTEHYSWVNLVVYDNIWTEEGEEIQTDGCKNITNYIIKNNRLFQISTCYGAGQEKTEEIYRYMLSTFKFID